MGVSGGGIAGGADINVALAGEGGKGFTKRLAELNAAQAAYEKALSDLNLGKSAVAAQTEAGRVLSAALDKTAADEAAFDAEMKKVRDTVNDWAEKTKNNTMAMLTEAQATLSDAQVRREAADAAFAAAQSANADAQARASVVLKDAQTQADDIVAMAQATADTIVAKAKEIDKVVRQSLMDAETAKAKYNAAMERIKLAAVE